MTRESDEECLKLIAEIREPDRGRPQWSEIDRLLDNLEARIKEPWTQNSAVDHADCRRMVGEMRIDREFCQAENARLRGQLADLGTEFVKLTGEVERLHAECEEKEIVRSCSSLAAPEDERQAKAEARSREQVAQAKQGCWGSGMPAQDREAMEARNERESAAVDALVFTEDCPCGTETCREAWRELRQAKQSPAIRTWLDSVQHEVDKLRRALEAEVS